MDDDVVYQENPSILESSQGDERSERADTIVRPFLLREIEPLKPTINHEYIKREVIKTDVSRKAEWSDTRAAFIG